MMNKSVNAADTVRSAPILSANRFSKKSGSVSDSVAIV